MMTILTDDIEAQVHAVLQEYGHPAPMTFVRTSGQTYDPTTGTLVGGGQITYSAYGYPWPYTMLERANELIKTEDNRLIIERTTQVPEPGDKVTFDGTQYRVVLVDKITMSGQKMAYQLQVRV
jgi:hypothetical protein